ncbi:DNA polymerase III subunit gamma and tau [Arthrobacter agilis]|uniref:DNA polymerase III subunit gamma and tau n=1 Tax=Arthrobacter agilis TaxID=37921 RepID=UPI0023656F22|nr:DNA polymerase III subunit gamma and tau [Arthrobacter agilis]WDF33675.1 DNA polymerase III subunit gamma and tau [Arthrobacter agilis]
MSTALYRRYRPETFADVIGQEHVTAPLMAAIDKDRINHAYLFSGPRGCGKTTSARILARCLNCAQGPTSTPCGVCDSCVGLARNGSGSLDVIEIDAASHGGVDDARDLRERATFAPVRDRFKIFIIDEAHMVTSAGFNALLKIVEEPPEHILFIFATTEPDKVIGTIRSRTHHYPFRLVPPEPLMGYLELLCRQENVPVAPGVLSLVIRAGGGSVRDSLSVLDQLMAGAGDAGLDYELAVSLLGYTHATLLDDVVESIAADDAGTVFDAVDRVIQTGHDPRRFVEDLLERFRDLIVINAVPEGAASILRGVPDDQLNRMRTQATQLGAGELSRAADVTNTALTEMTGATSPRLHLELLCARLLLPAADASERGTLARVDRIERRLEYAGGAPTSPDAPDAEPDAEPDAAPARPARPRLDVPRNAEEAAARWSLPTADPAAPAVPAAVPGAHSPAIPAAVRSDRPAQGAADTDSSPDWGGVWGVSTDSTVGGPGAAGAQPPAAAQQGNAERRMPGGPSAAADGTAPAQAEGAAGPTGPGAPDSIAPAQADSGQVLPAGRSGQHPPAAAPSNSTEPTTAAPWGDGDGSAPRQQANAPAPGAQREQSPAPAPQRHETDPREQPSDARGQRPTDTQGHQPSDARGQRPIPVQADRSPDAPRPDTRRDGPPQAGGGNVEMVRRAWPEIMDEVAKIKRATWLIVNVSAKPRSFEGNQLVLAFTNQGTAIGFQRGPHMDNVKQAIHTVLGLSCSIEAVHDAGGSGESGPKVPASQTGPGSTPGPGSAAPPAASSDVPAPAATAGAAVGSTQRPDPTASAPTPAPAPDSQASPAAAGSTQRPGSTGPAPAPAHAHATDPLEKPAAADGTPAPAASEKAGGVRSDQHTTSSPTATGPGAPVEDPPTRGPRSSNTDTDTGAVAGRGSRGPSTSSGAPATRITDAPSVSSTSPSNPGTAQDPRSSPTGRPTGSARSVEASPESVSAWDPSMADDSWALVEPPEEAFDPGPGWNTVPEDPFARPAPRDPQAPARGQPRGPAQGTPRPAQSTPGPAHGTPGTAPGTPGPAHGTPGPAQGTPGPASAPETSTQRSTPATPARGPARTPPAQRATGPAPGPSSAGAGAETAGSTPDTAPQATASRSVVWSPPPVTSSPSAAAPAGTPDAPAPAGDVRQKPVSRYQKLLDEAERKRAEEAAAARGAVDLRFVEDEPSADDETIEESGLVGRTAIERILNGRLVEERSVGGT